MPTVWPALLCIVSAFRDRKDLSNSSYRKSIQLRSIAKEDGDETSSSIHGLNNSIQRIRQSHDSGFRSISAESGTQTTLVGVCLEEGRHAELSLQFGNGISEDCKSVIKATQDKPR